MKELLFDTAAKPWSGNLGVYLHDQVRAGDAQVRVRVSGTGRFFFTPVILPEGTSLEIIVETSRSTGGVPPEWYPSKDATAEALIAVKGGDLVLTGVEVLRDASARLKSLFRVDDGHLIVNHCRLRAAGHGRAQGGQPDRVPRRKTRPLPARTGPFDRPFDKPVCRIIDSVLITTGDVVTAEVGGGMVALTECAVAAGGNAFVLFPAAVARSRFDADLAIEHCTIAAEKTFVFLGRWPGDDPGTRPALAGQLARQRLYVELQPGLAESVLLRVDPDSIARGALFWQGTNDAYELSNFTGAVRQARGDELPTRRPPVGEPLGDQSLPQPHRSDQSFEQRCSVRLRDRLRPGNVTPGELALDPDVHTGRSTLDLGVDMRRLQVHAGRGTPRAAPEVTPAAERRALRLRRSRRCRPVLSSERLLFGEVLPDNQGGNRRSGREGGLDHVELETHQLGDRVRADRRPRVGPVASWGPPPRRRGTARGRRTGRRGRGIRLFVPVL